MRALILVFGIVGTVLFGSAFVLSFSSPLLVENLGKEIRREKHKSIQLALSEYCRNTTVVIFSEWKSCRTR